MTNGRKNKAHSWGALSPFCRKQVLIYTGILLSGCHCPLRCICQRFLKRKILSNGIIILKKIMLAELSVGPPLIIDSSVYIYHLSNVPPVFAFLFNFIKLYLSKDCSLGRLDHNLSKTGHEAPPVHRSHVQNGQRTVTEHQSSVPHRHIEPSGSNKFPYIWRRIEQNTQSASWHILREFIYLVLLTTTTPGATATECSSPSAAYCHRMANLNPTGWIVLQYVVALC